MKKFFIIIIFYFPLIFDVLAKDLVVKDIEINGNVRYSEFVYKEFIGIKVGDRFNDGIRNEIIKNLFASDYVNNVRVNFHEGVLIINIEEKIFIKKITFNGNKKLKDDKIKENLKLKVKEMFSQNLLNQDLEFIGNFYKSIGLLNTAVSHELNYLEDNFVEVIFNVKESKKSKIKNIYFIGNKAFKSDTLKTKIFSREKKFYRFLSKTTSYNGDVLDYDAFLLKTFYWTNGYPDFEVISANGKFDSKSNTFDVIFDVEEGQKYYFNKFNIVSNVVGIDTDDLEYLVADVEAGDIFDINVVNKRVQKISNIVSRKNKFINVEPQIIPDKINDRINVNIIIDNAEHIYVGKILIKNNLRTHDSTIRQQLNFEEGSPFSNSDADRSMQKIMNLGFFKNATYTKQKGMFDNQVDITIMVEEKNSGSLNFGVGYSSLNKINGNFGVNQRNLFGRAINLDFNVNVDKYYRSFSFGIIKPSFLGTNMTAGINTFYSENDNRGNSAINIGYNDNSFGSSVFFNFTVTEYLLQTLKYTYSVEKLDNISDDYENILTDKKQKISEISVALSYDRRDNIHYPTKGYVLSYTFDFAGLIGTKDYLRNTLYFAHYYPIYTDVIVMKFEVKLANITSVNSNPLYPNDGFYLGGYSMRGFESAGIGPRVGANGNTVSSSYGVGGTRLYYSNLEIKFPLLKPRELNLYGIFFINAGTVTGVEKNPNVDRSLILDSGSIRSAAGFSIMWQTPMGNLNLDFSKVLKKETYDLGENFMFNIGKNF